MASAVGERPPDSYSRIDHGPGHERRVYTEITQLLSDEHNPTPLVRLNRVTGLQHAELYAKLEWRNPFGSVKDRVGANLLMDAEAKGLVTAESRLVEPTSGNTGLGLAMMCNSRRLPLTVPISTRVPAEKRNALRFLGADLIELDDDLWPKPGAREGAIAVAEELARQDGWFGPNQYKNPANPDAHYRTTGPEIWRQTEGKVTHVFASTGTCGTISGMGRFLKAMSGGRVKVHGVHPPEGHDIPGVRSIAQLKMTDHYAPENYDELVEVSNAEAFDMCRRLNQEESLIAGPSSGMQVVGALRLMADEPGNVGVIIFCDDVFKYTTSVTKHCPDVFPQQSAMPKFEPAELTALQSIMAVTQQGPDTVKLEQLEAYRSRVLDKDQEALLIIDVRPRDEFTSKMRALGAVNIPMKTLTGQEEGGAVKQVFDGIAGAVQKVEAAAAPKQPPLEALNEVFAAALGRTLPFDAPILLVCNRAVDTTFSMMYLKGLGFSNVRQVQKGMFHWAKAGMPVEEDLALVSMPQAKDDEERALLAECGFTSSGKPLRGE